MEIEPTCSTCTAVLPPPDGYLIALAGSTKTTSRPAMDTDTDLRFHETVGCEPWTFRPETPEGIDAERWQRFVEDVNACVKFNGRYTMTWMITIIALIILTCVVIMVALVSFFTLSSEATMVFLVALATGLGLCFIGGGLITFSGCAALNALEKVSKLCDALSEELGSEIKVYLAEVKEHQHRHKVVRIRRKVNPPEPPEPPEPDHEAVEVSAGNAGNDLETGAASQPNQPTD
eukprot:s4_g78.t1